MVWNPNSNEHKAKHGGYKGKPTKAQVKATLSFFDTSGLFKDMDFGKVNLIDKNAYEFRYVPVDKRSYTLSMIAVDKKAENFEFVNDENIDDEMVIRFIIAVLKKNYESEYALRDGRYSKTSPLDKAFSHIVKEGMRHTEMMEAKESVMLEVLRREPSVFTEFVKQSSERGFKQFEGLLNMSLCMVAVKGDKKNVSSIPHLFHERVWVEYVQNHLK